MKFYLKGNNEVSQSWLVSQINNLTDCEKEIVFYCQDKEVYCRLATSEVPQKYFMFMEGKNSKTTSYKFFDCDFDFMDILIQLFETQIQW